MSVRREKPKTGRRDSADTETFLYEHALPAHRTGPLFNAFSYPTKISPEAIGLFISTHTRPGDTVLDVFAGSGTTGLGAKLCDTPTPAMLDLAKQLGLKPAWGPRNAVLYEIGVLGSLIARVMCSPPDPERFQRAATDLIDSVEMSHGWLYETIGPSGQPGKVRHIVWSDILICRRCRRQTSFWDAAVRHNPLRLESSYKCSSCRVTNEIEDCKRATSRAYDQLLQRPVERRRRVPAAVYGISGRERWRRSPIPQDVRLAGRAAKESLPQSAPFAEINWGDLYRSGYHKGITHLHHFYTPRNFLALAALWEQIEAADADLRDVLRLLVLSFNASHSTLMTRVVVKQNQKDLVLTGAQSGVLYVSGLPVEKNVFEGVRRKAKTLTEAFRLVSASRSSVKVFNASSTNLKLADRSVDYVFTDPPFGDYIPYAEINQINELWLGKVTNRTREVVISKAQGKSAEAYGDLMTKVFSEISRVLRRTGKATVVFHSAKAEVWKALTDAYSRSGLSVRTTSVLDKTQASFKQTVSTTMVKGDPLILLTKSSKAKPSHRLSSVDDVVTAVLADASRSRTKGERARERLFSRFIARCLIEGLPVTMGAADFYRRAALEGYGP